MLTTMLARQIPHGRLPFLPLAYLDGAVEKSRQISAARPFDPIRGAAESYERTARAPEY